MAEMREMTKKRLADVTAKFISKHGVPLNDVRQFIVDVTQIYYDHMQVTPVYLEDANVETREH